LPLHNLQNIHGVYSRTDLQAPRNKSSASRRTKGCIRNAQGCKEQLIIDSAILEQAYKDNRSLYIAYIDYRKAFDSVPHGWLVRVLEIYKTDPLIINSLQQSMKKWTTTLQVKVNNNQVTSDPIRSTYEEYIKGTVLARYGSASH
jgi:hypothetical protein